MELYDPLRHKTVPATPEEKVRQWFIGELGNTFRVPLSMMNSEVAFNYGNKSYRADILIFDRGGRPLATVECKRPDVQLDSAVVEQAMRYNIVLNVRFLILTNGNNTYIYTLKEGKFVPMDHIPLYEEMLCQPY
ncbi:MAG: type I restriction enzyme HsdR N-terminal domain-containing protein [Bacteroidales bacterium]|nr:type I restriction enzyme HsdR N-terminal domain-containing protein [Bacteroidales bacterium]